MRPGGSARGANVAFSPTARSAMPRQFGPTSRAPCARTGGEQLLLARDALGADLGEARRDDAERAHARAERRFGGVEHVLAGDADHGEVDGSGISSIGVRADAGDRLAAG